MRQFLEVNFYENLQASIVKHQLDNNLITIEITESLFIEELDYILPLLEKISASGISISLDDFGTGYSSLSMLRSLPITELKIDKLFVDEILLDSRAKSMLDGIIAIGQNLGIHTLAEGVETHEQAALLKEMKCDVLQGYLYAKPLSMDDLAEYLSDKTIFAHGS